MPRQYIVNSWVGACEFDEGDTYSGEQIGNRNQKSIGVLIERSGDQWKAGNVSQDIPTYVNGRANVSAFAEPVTKPKAKPKKSAFQTVTLADSHYERLANLSEELDKELESGKLSFDDWSYARKTLDVRLEKAWHRLSLARGWTSHASDDPSQPLDFTLNAEAPRPIAINYTVIPSDSVFAEIQDGNCFKIAYTICLTVCKWFVKFTSTAKQLVQEGLV